MSEKIDRVLAYLDRYHIQYTRTDHPPVATIEESKLHWRNLKGMHCKNLFMRDNKGKKHYLIVAEANKAVDIKSLNAKLSDRLSFASPQRLEKHLDLTPGSVSPFGLINNEDHKVILIIDQSLKDAQYVNFHPNLNTATLTLTKDAFDRYLSSLKHNILYMEL